MVTPSLDIETIQVLREFNRNVGWLKQQSIKQKPKEEWGGYEKAAAILSRSKQWYKIARLGRIIEEVYATAPKLEKGKDWRMVGNEVEYRLAAIEALKEKQ